MESIVIYGLHVLAFLLVLGQLFYDIASFSLKKLTRRINYFVDTAPVVTLAALTTGLILTSRPYPLALVASIIALLLLIAQLLPRGKHIPVNLALAAEASSLALILLSSLVWDNPFLYDPRGGFLLSTIIPVILAVLAGIAGLKLRLVMENSMVGWYKISILQCLLSLTGILIINAWLLISTSYTGAWFSPPPSSILLSFLLLGILDVILWSVSLPKKLSNNIRVFSMVSYLVLLMNIFSFLLGYLPTPIYSLKVTAANEANLLTLVFLTFSALPLSIYLIRRRQELVVFISQSPVSILPAPLIYLLASLYPLIRLSIGVTSISISQLESVIISITLGYTALVFLIYRETSNILTTMSSFLLLILALIMLVYPFTSIWFIKETLVSFRISSVEPGSSSEVHPPSLVVAHGFFLLYGALKGYPPAIYALTANVSKQEAEARLATINEINKLFASIGIIDKYNVSEAVIPQKLPSMVVGLRSYDGSYKVIINASLLLGQCRPYVIPASKKLNGIGLLSIKPGDLDKQTSVHLYKLYLWMISRPQVSGNKSLMYSVYVAEASSWCISRSLNMTFSLLRESITKDTLPVEILKLTVIDDPLALCPNIFLALSLLLCIVMAYMARSYRNR